MDFSKVTDSRKKFSSPSRYFLVLLMFCLLYFIFFFYRSNITGLTVDWKWWPKATTNSTPGGWRSFVQLNVTTSKSVTEQNGTARRNSTNGFSENIAGGVVSTSPVWEPTTPAPYVSPGPYLVEYPSDYHFTINQPNKCEEMKPFVAVLVPVAPKNKAHRDIIRSTWGRDSLVQNKVVSFFFLLGLYTGEGSREVQEQVELESEEHQDLIQANFVDCYKNLTIKTMMMLTWLDAHCSGAAYAMKIDSDMFLVVNNLIQMLANAPKTDYLTGLVTSHGLVLRNKDSKWYLPQDVFPRPYYPKYALGLGYVMSSDMPKKLLEASKHVRAVYIEDVYLGLCMEYLGISPTDPPDWNYFKVIPVPYDRCAYSKIIATTTNEREDRMWMWADFSRPGPHC